MFRTVPLSIIRSFSLYIEQWCMSCRFVDGLRAGSGLSVLILLASNYSEGPATGHLDTGFSWFPCVYKQMLICFPRFQVATTCFSCSPPDVNLFFTLAAGLLARSQYSEGPATGHLDTVWIRKTN